MDISDFLRVHGGDDFKWFSRSLSKANAIHQKKKAKKKLNAADRIQLNKAYSTIVFNLQRSDPVLFRERVPPHEIKAWLNHSVEAFRQISDDQQWIKTGTLKQYDLWLLKAQMMLMDHAVPVAMAFETDFFQALASFISIRRGASNNAPSAEISIADLITFLMMHVVRSCVNLFENKWTPEKVLTKLAATGLLEQFLLCSAISRHELADIAISQIRDQLLRCPVFVGQKFKKGSPCGDTVRAILASGHGHTPYRLVATNFLETLVKLSSVMEPSNNIQACGCCKSSSPSSDFQNKLMQCSRCRAAYYCSTECQTADWKNHKKFCKRHSKLPKSQQKIVEASDHLLNGFTRINYVHIMKAFVMECDKSGEQKKDMVIEVSFAPDSTGKIPALQDPPELSIVPIKRYFDGSRLLESDGIYKGTDLTAREEFGPSVLQVLKLNHSSHLSSTGVLYVYRNVDSFSQFLAAHKQNQIYSQEAIDAFRLAMNDNDFGPIANICRGDDKVMDLLRAQMGMPDESTVPNAL